MNNTQQQMFGADVVVVEEPRLLLGEDDYLPGVIGEMLKTRQGAYDQQRTTVAQMPSSEE